MQLRIIATTLLLFFLIILLKAKNKTEISFSMIYGQSGWLKIKWRYDKISLISSQSGTGLKTYSDKVLIRRARKIGALILLLISWILSVRLWSTYSWYLKANYPTSTEMAGLFTAIWVNSTLFTFILYMFSNHWIF